MADFVSLLAQNYTRPDPISSFAQGAQIRAELMKIQQQTQTQVFNSMLDMMRLQDERKNNEQRNEIAMMNAQAAQAESEARMAKLNQPKYADPLDRAYMEARIAATNRQGMGRTASSSTFTPIPAGVYGPGEIPQTSEPSMPTQDGQYQPAGSLFPAGPDGQPLNQQAFDVRQAEAEIVRLENALQSQGQGASQEAKNKLLPIPPPPPGGYPDGTSAQSSQLPPSTANALQSASQQTTQQPQQGSGAFNFEGVPEGQIFTQSDGMGGITQYQKMNGIPMFRTYRESSKGITGDSGWEKVPQAEKIDPITQKTKELDLQIKQAELDKLRNPSARADDEVRKEYNTSIMKIIDLQSKAKSPSDESKVAAFEAKYGTGVKPQTEDQWREAYNLAANSDELNQLQEKVNLLKQQFPELVQGQRQDSQPMAPRPTVPGAPPQAQSNPQMIPAGQGAMRPQNQPQAQTQPIVRPTIDDFETPQQRMARMSQDNPDDTAIKAEWTRAKEIASEKLGRITRLTPEVAAQAATAVRNGVADRNQQTIYDTIGVAKSVVGNEMIPTGKMAPTGGMGVGSTTQETIPAMAYYAKQYGIKPQKVAGKEISPEILLKAWAEEVLTSAGLIGEPSKMIGQNEQMSLGAGVVARRKQ